jgi:hypothetical protein
MTVDCVPGSSVSCACPDGIAAIQMCSGDHSFGRCSCSTVDGGVENIERISLDTVLEIPDPTDGGMIAAHVSHGRFWEPAVFFPSVFFWDAYLAPRTPGYLVSDGYGANHEMLWQAQPSADATQLIFQGSVFDGANEAFTAAEGSAPGEWGYYAVNLTSTLGPPYVFTYWNGIAVGISAFSPQPRRSVPPTNHGEGNLYVMGATAGHTLGGRIAALRAWDVTTPLGTDNPNWAFVPERTFSHESGTKPVDLLIDYTVGGVQIPDLAPIGYAGGGMGPRRPHPGNLVNFPEDQVSQNFGPGPRWVHDLQSPYGKAGSLVNTGERVPPRSPSPAMSLAFDSFARPSQTFAFQTVPSIGSAEAGSIGARMWNVGSLGPPIMTSPFGILNGRAVFLERQPAVAWINCGAPDLDIRLTRFIGPGQVGTTGIAFRVVDSRNWWYGILVAQPTGFSSGPQLRVGYFEAGSGHDVATYTNPPGNWKILRVKTVGSIVTFFVDDQAGGWLTVGSVTNVALQSATGAGLAGARRADEATSLWRGDDFTVCSAVGGC